MMTDEEKMALVRDICDRDCLPYPPEVIRWLMQAGRK